MVHYSSAVNIQVTWTDADLYFWYYRDEDQADVEIFYNKGAENVGC